MNSRLQAILNLPRDGYEHEFADTFVRTNCSHPTKRFFYDRHTRQKREMIVSCGKCPTCRDRHVGSWLSRMCLHTDYCRKYCYFITLTYKCFYKYESIPTFLRDAYWRLDSHNSTKHLAYSPCLLRYEHVQRFLKYLRKQLPSNCLDFFVGSEYGSDYGRPHHHLILWSDFPITKIMLYKAWSYNSSNSRKFSLPLAIGKIDFVDFQIGYTQSDKKRAFRYVAKYCSKNYIDNDYMHKSRAHYLFDDIVSISYVPSLCNSIFNDRIRKKYLLLYAHYLSKILYKLDCEDYDKCVSQLCNTTRSLSEFYNLVQFFKNVNPYDKNNACTDTSYLFVSLDTYFESEEINNLLRDFYCSLSETFLLQPFIPRCNSSRANAIGKMYLLQNAAKYQGDYRKLPKSCETSLLFPRYFEKLLAKNFERYVLVLPPLCNKQPSFISCIDKVQFAHIYKQLPYLDIFQNSDVPFYSTFGGCYNKQTINEYLRTRPYFFDYLSGCRVVPYLDPFGDLTIRSYKYNLRSKSFVLNDVQSLESFCDCVELAISSFSDYYIKRLNKLADSVTEFDDLRIQINNLDTLLSDAELDYIAFRDSFIKSRSKPQCIE